MRRRKRPPAPQRAVLSRSAARPRRWFGPLLFVVALVVRLLFWQASVDAGWPDSASYKGDAWVWLEWATALQAGQTFELGIPIRPPGAAYLLAALWDGTLPGLRWVGLAWAILGALAVALFHGAARRVAGAAVGAATGLLCAGSSGLVMLSTSLNNETPYLVLLAAILWLAARWQPAAGAEGPGGAPAGAVVAPGAGALAAWGALNALACLMRVEHALFFGPALLWLGWRWSAGDLRALARPLAVAGAAFVAVLLPWHLTIWSTLADLNRGASRQSAAADRALTAQEGMLGHLEWEAAAAAARDAIPAFIRRPAASFVAATVAHRGGRQVTAADFGLLDDAFGYVPEPLAAWPFVVATGGLNFALANHAASSGGFDPRPLAEPPPLRGGAGAYPAPLIAGLPPRQLAFTYPGHLRLVNEGYRVGLGWMASDPAAAVGLMGRKLALFWRGAALGVGGWNLPLGPGGLRRPVDLVTPEGAWPAAWRTLVVLAAAWGATRAWRRRGPRLWLLFLAGKVVVALAFYGYARQGATAFPAIALCLAAAAEPWLPRLDDRRLWLATLSAGALLVAVEAARWASRPELAIDGRAVGARDSLAPGEHEAHTISWR